MSYESRLVKLERRSAIKPHVVESCTFELTSEYLERVREIMLEIPCIAEDGSESNSWEELLKSLSDAEFCEHSGGQDTENIE